MLLSLGLIIILGLLGNLIFTKLKLPGLLGMLIVGILIGPNLLNLIDESILKISSDLRKIALIVILIRAGLGIKASDIKETGKTSLLLSFVPGVFEGLTVALISGYFLGFNFVQGGMLGFILAAVSPAVVVPFMLKLISEKRGENKKIPVMILSAVSIDDVFAITFFTCFLNFYLHNNTSIALQLLNIPISIILGIGLGLLLGILLVYLFKKLNIKDTRKVILVLAVSLILVSVEKLLENYIMIASLLGVMALGFIINHQDKDNNVSSYLSNSFNNIWIFAEILLFVLVGALVDVKVALNAGLKGLIVISIGLIARSLGVLISTLGSKLNNKEKLFTVFSYIPKATVQAAIGSIPLIYGVDGGEIILAISVLAILFTAPLGAVLIKLSSNKLLKKGGCKEIK